MLWLDYLSYCAVRGLLFPLSLLPLKWVHRTGKLVGRGAYYLLPSFRKKTLSHLSLALKIEGPELICLAKQSFANLAITFLEYGALARKDIASIATCENPDLALSFIRQGTPPIFFCGHQTNWEILFLEGTSRMPGVAIGRPIKNTYLYNWILKIREKYGGKMIAPKSAVKEGLRGLKKGSFLGIVGDQGMPDSGFSSPFFGHNAWTSPLPALLSYRTGFPVMVATTQRFDGKYSIRYSDPIFPNLSAPAEEEIPRIMKQALFYFEESIRQKPADWLWIHNRWKQQPVSKIKRSFRHESICVVLEDHKHLSSLHTLKKIYPYEFITAFIPKDYATETFPEGISLVFFSTLDEVKVRDHRFKLLFNLTSDQSITRHFKRLSVMKAVSLSTLQSKTLEELICAS